jgi:RimJ/RimL family protein N-acetyltransferase
MGLFPTTAESPRLRYEALHPDRTDPRELYRHVGADAPNVEEMTRWMTWDPHPHQKATAEFVDRAGEAFEAEEGVTFAVYPRDGEDGAGELAGTSSLDVDWDRQRGTFGVWFRKRFWGRGYSGERARTLAALAFDVLDLEVVAVTHAPANENSRRAIEKYVDALGGRREGRIRNDIVLGDEPRDAVRYSVAVDEWRAATGGDYEATFEW